MLNSRIDSEDLEKITHVILKLLEAEPELRGNEVLLNRRIQSHLNLFVMPPPMTEGVPVTAASVHELLTMVQGALRGGFTVIASDDPYRRLIGYQVLNGNEPFQYLHIGLAPMRDTMNSHALTSFGVDPKLVYDCMRNPGGRRAIIDMLKGMSPEAALTELADG